MRRKRAKHDVNAIGTLADSGWGVFSQGKSDTKPVYN
jgi:hypothetical protein